MTHIDLPDIGSTAESLALAEQRFVAGRRDEAQAICRQILQREPGCAEASHLLGLIAHGAGDLASAIRLVEDAIEAGGDISCYHANLCEFRRQDGRLTAALAAGRRAVALDAGSASALNNLGIVHFDLGDYAEAAACYRRALALAPADVQAQSNLGNALLAVRDFDAAIAAFRRAVEIDPHFADAWSSLGSAFNLLGRRDEALEAYRAAVARDPLHGAGHTGLAMQLLLRGDFDAGWFEYEWRWRSPELSAGALAGDQWRGDDVAGRRILVRAEQGLGDTLQFCRYALALRQRGAEVVLSVPRPLVRLLAGSLACEVVAEDEPAPACDVECSMMSLPLLFGTREDTIPGPMRYLSAPAAETAVWRGRVARPPLLSVGLAWAGNPRHVNDHNRSIAPALLAPLLRLEGVRWVSLQVGRLASELPAPAPFDVLDASAHIGDFSDTAAALCALDLVICIDSAVAHLAGALSRPAWVLLPVGGDWRWLVDRDTSPWHPTLRLFRQAAYGQWAPVIDEVAAALHTLLRQSP